jgi:formylglycine-generating enzyme required for sulfatase activity
MRKRLLPFQIVIGLLAGISVTALAQTANDKVDSQKARTPRIGDVPFDAETAKRLQEEWAKHLSLDKSSKNSIGIEIILIPPGKFRMGNNEVALELPFHIGKTEVTQKQWLALMGTAPWMEKEKQGNNRPATFDNRPERN